MCIDTVMRQLSTRSDVQCHMRASLHMGMAALHAGSKASTWVRMVVCMQAHVSLRVVSAISYSVWL